MKVWNLNKKRVLIEFEKWNRVNRRLTNWNRRSLEISHLEIGKTAVSTWKFLKIIDK